MAEVEFKSEASSDLEDSLESGSPLIALSGLPGMGKSTVLNQVAERIGGLVVEVNHKEDIKEPAGPHTLRRVFALEDIPSASIIDLIQRCRTQSATVVLCHLPQFLPNEVLAQGVKHVSVRSLPEGEDTNWFHTNSPLAKETNDRAEIATKYALGIPALIEQFAAIADLTEETAAQRLADYLAKVVSILRYHGDGADSLSQIIEEQTGHRLPHEVFEYLNQKIAPDADEVALQRAGICDINTDISRRFRVLLDEKHETAVSVSVLAEMNNVQSLLTDLDFPRTPDLGILDHAGVSRRKISFSVRHDKKELFGAFGPNIGWKEMNVIKRQWNSLSEEPALDRDATQLFFDVRDHPYCPEDVYRAGVALEHVLRRYSCNYRSIINGHPSSLFTFLS